MIKKAVAMVLTAAMMVSVAPNMVVDAATYKATTANKVKTITKTGQHGVEVPANSKQNYVQFKAPKAGTYVFKIGGITYDGEVEDAQNMEYYTTSSYDYMGMVNVAPIINGKLKTQSSLVNVHALYDTVAALSGMTNEEFVEAADAEGLSVSDIETIGKNNVGIELTHTYKIKLKKGQTIQFVFLNVSAEYNKYKQNVPIKITKK